MRFASTPGGDVAGGSAGLVLTIPHGGSEHHGGMIAFGPDRMLYMGPGDGGCCGDPNDNAQNLNSLLGKLLRIDVRTRPYTVPASNPFDAHRTWAGVALAWCTPSQVALTGAGIARRRPCSDSRPNSRPR